MATEVFQGHPYDYLGDKVIVLSHSARYARILVSDENNPWECSIWTVNICWLKELPLRYLHNEYYRKKDRHSVRQGVSESTDPITQCEGTQDSGTDACPSEHLLDPTLGQGS